MKSAVWAPRHVHISRNPYIRTYKNMNIRIFISVNIASCQLGGSFEVANATHLNYDGAVRFSSELKRILNEMGELSQEPDSHL